jgi:hypothetical protein
MGKKDKKVYEIDGKKLTIQELFWNYEKYQDKVRSGDVIRLDEKTPTKDKEWEKFYNGHLEEFKKNNFI